MHSHTQTLIQEQNMYKHIFMCRHTKIQYIHACIHVHIGKGSKGKQNV